MSQNLAWVIKNGDLDQVKHLIENQNTSVNDEVAGRTPLHYAADYGQEEVMLYLISKGANLNALDKHGISPILAAIWEGHTRCVKLLIEKGASKEGNAPDGTSYKDSAEKLEIKSLLL